ncbi:hypothetical protein CACET_c26620 [Clostridium aceticum]|uniref:Uncharacterized protein n=1 Tax=Clostridium aceticum TaxID=84022 RepID=A0A0D8I650_9CLOT|nr:hypothetical protein [Clostridium aceticum]AKL96107.1 hypothetical protein CACET_c26620 [Clostridium aceticum]KJF25529.1 hypothetical protein TZ02_18155 [Clostridium aceticum]
MGQTKRPHGHPWPVPMASPMAILMEMHKAGIPTVVWLTPILPFINDNEENILGIIDYCRKAKVTGVLTFGIGMIYFPELKKGYMKKYALSYGIKSPNILIWKIF